MSRLLFLVVLPSLALGNPVSSSATLLRREKYGVALGTERYDRFVQRGKDLMSKELFVDLAKTMDPTWKDHPINLVAGRASFGKPGEITFDSQGSHEMVKALYYIAYGNPLENGSNIDGAYMFLDQIPDCHMVYRPIEAISASQIGPGTIKITKSNRTAKLYELGVSIKFDVAVEIPASKDAKNKDEKKKDPYSFKFSLSNSETRTFNDVMDNSVGHRFHVPAGASCTPSVMVAGRVCSNVRGEAQFYKDSRLDSIQAFNHKSVFVPTTYDGSVKFKDLTGCIDYLPPSSQARFLPK